MAQTTITIAQLRKYTRDLETRLGNKAKYPDSWIDDTINTGFLLSSNKRQPFFKSETLDLTQYIIDSTAKFEVDVSEDVIGWRNIFYKREGTVIYTDAVSWQLLEDNKIVVDIIPSALNSSESNTITFEYYFSPKVDSITEMFMPSDVLQMLKYGIGVAAFQNIRDEKSEGNMLQRFEAVSKLVTNGLDIYGNDVVKSNWDFSGFYK